MGSTSERVYHAKQDAGWGPRVWRAMFAEIWHGRDLVRQLFLRDFIARYKQSALGIVWALILPLIAVSTFVILNSSGLLKVDDTGIPYPVYAMLGLTIWQIFAGGLTACSNAIISGGSMVVKINFPKETLVIAALGQVIFELAVRLVLLLIVMGIFQVMPKWTIVLFPIMLLPLILLTLGMGLFLSLANTLLRDVAHVVTLATSFLMFVTPVVYPAPKSGFLATLMVLNPLAGLITGSRDIVTTGYLTDPAAFTWATCLALAFCLFAWRVFHLTEPRMAERL